MSAVKEADADAQALDDAFAAAMEAPARPREPSAPPEVDNDAPHGRDENGQPLAPYGLTKDGKPRRSAAGRRAKDDQPRTAPAGSGTGAGPGETPGVSAPASTRDYTGPLSEFADAVWFVGSALGKGGSALPLVGQYIPERKVAAQAGVFKAYKANLVSAVNTAAQHNARAARFAARIETGDITWVAMCAFMTMPFLTMSAAIWKGDKALAAAGVQGGVQALAAANDTQLDAYMAEVSAQMDALAKQAQAEAMAQLEEAQQAAAMNGHTPQEAPV